MSLTSRQNASSSGICLQVSHGVGDVDGKCTDVQKKHSSHEGQALTVTYLRIVPAHRQGQHARQPGNIQRVCFEYVEEILLTDTTAIGEERVMRKCPIRNDQTDTCVDIFLPLPSEISSDSLLMRTCLLQ